MLRHSVRSASRLPISKAFSSPRIVAVWNANTEYDSSSKLVSSFIGVASSLQSPFSNVPSRTFWTRLFRSSQHGSEAPVNTSAARLKAIRDRLTDAMKPELLDVQDVSGGCGAFFKLLVVTDAFEGKTTVARHRLVQALLKEDIKSMHGITMTTLTPSQFAELQTQAKIESASSAASPSSSTPAASSSATAAAAAPAAPATAAAASVTSQAAAPQAAASFSTPAFTAAASRNG